jgi:hypothetical protein
MVRHGQWSQGDHHMQDSSFKVAAAIFGIGALLKISALAIALAMLGLAGSAQAGVVAATL